MELSAVEWSLTSVVDITVAVPDISPRSNIVSFRSPMYPSTHAQWDIFHEEILVILRCRISFQTYGGQALKLI